MLSEFGCTAPTDIGLVEKENRPTFVDRNKVLVPLDKRPRLAHMFDKLKLDSFPVYEHAWSERKSGETKRVKRTFLGQRLGLSNLVELIDMFKLRPGPYRADACF